MEIEIRVFWLRISRKVDYIFSTFSGKFEPSFTGGNGFGF
jgi:hypothetical protein